jgi:hypothetical protein
MHTLGQRGPGVVCRRAHPHVVCGCGGGLAAFSFNAIEKRIGSRHGCGGGRGGVLLESHADHQDVFVVFLQTENELSRKLLFYIGCA